MSGVAGLCWIAAGVCLWAWIAAAYHEYRARLARDAAEHAAKIATAANDPAQAENPAPLESRDRMKQRRR